MTVQTLLCPSCASPLVTRRSGRGQVWVCPACAGCLVGVAVLREGVDGQAVGRFWSQARVRPQARRCPACGLALASARVPDGPELDACRTCFLIWCDGGELERLPPRRREAPSQPSRHPGSVPSAVTGVETTDAGDLLVDAAGVVIDILLSWH